jgi:hypothetical protein
MILASTGYAVLLWIREPAFENSDFIVLKRMR